MGYSLLEPVNVFRTLFLSTAAAVIGGSIVPPIQKRLFLYGPRQVRSDGRAGKSENSHNNKSFLDSVYIPEVPHSWFAHFYVLSVASSIFWGFQMVFHGRVFQYIASKQLIHGDDEATLSISQIFLVWLFMTLQGSRRLYECVALAKPSQSKMPIPHYALGLAFYLFVGVAVWIEGIPTLISWQLSIESITINTLSFKTFIATTIFLFASGIQHDCHSYLASLQRYTLPQHPMFQHILCPHYTVECLVYVSLAILAAPNGQLFNKTILAAFAFVAANLGVTAESSRRWYLQKFGEEKIKNRWRMVPMVY